MIMKILGGFLMALADSVPGVSGGTIAFILGLYDDFINSLNNIVSKDKEKQKAAFLFLLKLGSGWIVGMAGAAMVITSIFEKHIYAISSLFIGFVLFSIPLIIMEEKETLKGKYKNLVFTVLGILLLVAITYLAQNGILKGNVDLSISGLNFGLCIYVFFAAMCAISAMVLPGISGSTLLLVFGIYQAILGALMGLLTGVIKGDFSYLPIVIIFAAGVAVGIFTIVKLLKRGLEKHRSAMMYFILGMMIGSLYAIVMGPTSISEPVAPLSWKTFGFVYFVAGGIIIFGLQALKGAFEKREAEKDAAKQVEEQK